MLSQFKRRNTRRCSRHRRRTWVFSLVTITILLSFDCATGPIVQRHKDAVLGYNINTYIYNMKIAYSDAYIIHTSCRLHDVVGRYISCTTNEFIISQHYVLYCYSSTYIIIIYVELLFFFSFESTVQLLRAFDWRLPEFDLCLGIYYVISSILSNRLVVNISSSD